MIGESANIGQPREYRWEIIRERLQHSAASTALILLAAAISAGLFFAPQLWWRGDDAEFVTLARGLASGGWMRYINMPG